MGRIKAYTGTSLVRTYIDGNVAVNEGDFRPLPAIVNPSSLSSLQYWLDPVDVGGNVSSVPNGGAAGGTWSINADTYASSSNFVSGSGTTKEFIFGQGGSQINDTVFSVGRNMKNDGFAAAGALNTVISIARIGVNSSGYCRIWGMASTTDSGSSGNTTGGNLPAHIFNPTESLDLQIGFEGLSGGIQYEPNIDLGTYSYGETNLRFFATTVDGDWYNDYDTIKMQSGIRNNTSITPNKTHFPTATRYYQGFAVGQNPGVNTALTGVAAVMVFDEILDEDTIGGIYRYYSETRGYSIV